MLPIPAYFPVTAATNSQSRKYCFDEALSVRYRTQAIHRRDNLSHI
jgi:hypothetical protein